MPCSSPSRIRLVVAAVLATTVVSVFVDAQTRTGTKNFLWKVESGSKVLYLAGSVHALNADVYPLNPAFERAFAASGALVEEIDLGEAATVAAVPMLARAGLYQDGRTLEQAVSRETMALIADRAKTVGLPPEALSRMKPWMVMLTFTALEASQAGFDTKLGLDKYFFDKATAAGKSVIGLETVQFQIGRFDGMNNLTQEQLLRSTLAELDTGPAAMRDLVAAWQSGDTGFFEKNVVDSFKEYPAAYASLIADRNRAWIPHLDACLARPTPCFVVVGAAHLVGSEGVLALLSRKGYRIEQQ